MGVSIYLLNIYYVIINPVLALAEISQIKAKLNSVPQKPSNRELDQDEEDDHKNPGEGGGPGADWRHELGHR